MRRLLPPLLALVCLFAAGCKATDTDDPPENAKPLKVQHALGVVRVPGESERPLTLYPSELDDALALGVTPVASATVGGGLPHYLGARTKDIEQVGSVAKPDVPRIAQINPDLILAAKPTQVKLYTQLKEIAPTVYLTEGINWKANFRQDGEALGIPDKAESYLDRYDERAAQVRKLAAGKTPALPAELEAAERRPFIASILDDVGIPHGKPGTSNTLPGAKPGPNDEWTIGEGYLAALKVLADLSGK